VYLAKTTRKKDTYPHTFRHTLAITYPRSRSHIFTARSLLGHSSLEMARRYARIAEIDIGQTYTEWLCWLARSMTRCSGFHLAAGDRQYHLAQAVRHRILQTEYEPHELLGEEFPELAAFRITPFGKELLEAINGAMVHEHP
jgi:hypothetical protein